MEPQAAAIQNRFASLALDRHLPHAVLLKGGDNRALLALAKQLVLIAVCSDETKKPCGKCAHCKKAKDGNHPDVVFVEEPDKKRKTISVDLIRWVREDAIVRPNEADRKIYVIPKADTMTREAQNALLKVLEEPPAYAMFLLLCANDTDLLPTIRSRTQLYALEAQPVLTGNTMEMARAIALAISAPTEAELLLASAPLVKAKDREKLRDVLSGLELILRDCCVRRAGGQALVSDSDNCVETLCKKISHRRLLGMLEEVQRTSDLNDRNLSLPLLITCLCAHLRQLAAG